MFTPFVEDEGVRAYGVEAAGHGIPTGEHAAAFADLKEGVLHGSYMYLLQDDHGMVQEAISISAGLDYPGVGPRNIVIYTLLDALSINLLQMKTH